MKFISFKKDLAVKSLGAVALTVALGAGMVGCGGGGGEEGGAVAATVNGQDIMEQTVTDYVADFRTAYSLESDEDWAKWMIANGYTPEMVRDEVIDYYVEQDLYEQAAVEYDVVVEQSEIDAQVEQTKAMFESEEAFQQALEAQRLTEESYIETMVRPGILQTKLSEAVVAALSDGDSDAAMLAEAQQMLPQWDGAKRSSHILFRSDDSKTEEELQAEAQAVLDQLNAGTLTFEEAAKQYSADGSAANGGDVGWDKLNPFVTEYQDALDDLEEGQISGLVTTDYGVHIIQCTDVFTVPEGGLTSLDQLPEDFQDYVAYVQQNAASSSFATWFEDYKANADIVVNPMPADVPYNIDLTPYEDAAAAAQAVIDDAAADNGEGASADGAEGTEGGTASAGEPAADGADAQPAEGADGAADGAEAPADDAAEGTPAQ